MLEPTILVHGGAGSIPATSQEAHRQGCVAAARAGGEVLLAGGSAVEAVCAAVEVLENNPIFNAGRGCALAMDGKISLDAAVMCGHSLDAAGVGCISSFANPVRIAQELLSKNEVLLVGPHAERWALDHGFATVPKEDLITDDVRQVWNRVVNEGGSANFAGGTVGAVCRDSDGRMAAATSTGGTMGKTPGRIGDSPLIGAGTFADEKCAVSATGEGESFIRAVFAGQVACAIRDGLTPAHALGALLDRVRDVYQGIGGAILLTVDGPPISLCTTETMSWASWAPSDEDDGI